MALGSTQTVTGTSKRVISLGVKAAAA